MDKAEAIQILSILKAAYPASFRNMKINDANAMISLWAAHFADIPYLMVQAAVNMRIDTADSDFAPNVAEIKTKIRDMQNPDKLTSFEAWRLVMKAASNGYYHSKEEFAKLPVLVQKTLRTPDTLREYALMDTNQLNTVVASNFRKSFESVENREKDMAAIPADMKKILYELSGSMAMDGGKQLA